MIQTKYIAVCDNCGSKSTYDAGLVAGGKTGLNAILSKAGWHMGKQLLCRACWAKLNPKPAAAKKPAKAK